jgi:hypothetical protein
MYNREMNGKIHADNLHFLIKATVNSKYKASWKVKIYLIKEREKFVNHYF